MRPLIYYKKNCLLVSDADLLSYSYIDLEADIYTFISVHYAWKICVIVNVFILSIRALR